MSLKDRDEGSVTGTQGDPWAGGEGRINTPPCLFSLSDFLQLSLDQPNQKSEGKGVQVIQFVEFSFQRNTVEQQEAEMNKGEEIGNGQHITFSISFLRMDAKSLKNNVATVF